MRLFTHQTCSQSSSSRSACVSVFLFFIVRVRACACVYVCVCACECVCLCAWQHEDNRMHVFRMVQCVAFRCQCVAVCCSVSQCVTVCYSVLQCVAVCCSVLQCVAVCYSVVPLDTCTTRHFRSRIIPRRRIGIRWDMNQLLPIRGIPVMLNIHI